MTTLAANTPRALEVGDMNDIPVIAADIIYEGSAVGVVTGSGHAQPLTSADSFAGFCIDTVDNSAGAAAAVNVKVRTRGDVELSVSGAVITDIDQPVYATDDNAFVFLPTGAVFIGFVKRYVSSGVVIVRFDAGMLRDPYAVYGAPGEYTTVADNLTLDIEDTGKVLFVTTDAKTITLPAIATPLTATIVNIAAYGTVLVKVAPNASDMIHAPDIAGTNNKAHQNTKASAQRGDLVTIQSPSDADGWGVLNQIGTWAQEG